jgi:hypothetical protein
MDPENLVSVQYKWFVSTQRRQPVVAAAGLLLSVAEATASEDLSSRTSEARMPETRSGITIWEATAVPIFRDAAAITICREVVAGVRRWPVVVVVATAEDRIRL